MIYAFYFRLYKLTGNRTISILLSKILYSVYLLRFEFKRLFLKKTEIDLDQARAEEIVRNICSDPQKRPDYFREPLNGKIDLSIIIPVYNYIELVPACVESVLCQKTKYCYELILVDDGSTDGTGKLIDQYKSYSQVIVIHQKNQGIGAARNTGIRHAHGRYIMFIDCDDTVRSDIVDNLMSCALETDSDIVMCAHELIKVRNGEIYQVLPNVYPSANLMGFRNNDEIMNYAGLPWAKVYRRELFEQVRFFPGYWNEDTIVHMLLYTQCKKFTYLPLIEYEYRWYEKNFSKVQGNSKNNRAAEYIWLLRAIVEHYDEMGLPSDAKFYTALLRHLSCYYYPKIAGLPEEVVQALFIMGRELLIKYKPSDRVKLPYVLRLTEKAIVQKDIELWKLVSRNQ